MIIVDLDYLVNFAETNNVLGGISKRFSKQDFANLVIQNREVGRVSGEVNVEGNGLVDAEVEGEQHSFVGISNGGIVSSFDFVGSSRSSAVVN
jgi:hypothetical protein